MKFFLSYASDEDKRLAEEIKDEIERLDTRNPHTVFVDYASLLKSQDADQRINNLLEQVDAVLFLLTVSSVRSFWCGKEVGFAQCLGKPIVPIAGPAVSAEFIKSQSVPWISSLKWVNWWEKDRARRIIEGVGFTQNIVELVDAATLERQAPAPSGADLYYGFENTREFEVFDLRVRAQILLAGEAGGAVYPKDREDVHVRLDREAACTAYGPISAFKHGSDSLSRESLAKMLRTAEDRKTVCRVLFLLRYCIGGQQYLTRVIHRPLLDVCSNELRAAVMAPRAATTTT
jgi:hypothetical protein